MTESLKGIWQLPTKTMETRMKEKAFQTCLLCHQVGNKGQNIAPALDGSASREYEALLTAILNPDAAVESNYAVYRVKKKMVKALRVIWSTRMPAEQP